MWYFLGGVFMYGEGGNPFPHDGEHGADCTGYGSCDCDEKNYGYRGGGSSGGSSGDNSYHLFRPRKWLISEVFIYQNV